ncbi:MAG: hypothetical protein J2P26_06090 [Nocardiopsaceae bacterium]|nr:hypothetical protein [Nocardiopsaceae bacterium]
MVWPGWWSLAGTEIVNNNRAAAYAGTAGLVLECDTCPALPMALGHRAYVSPGVDPAPWWDDANARVAARVFGFVGLDLQGFGKAPTTRQVTQLVTGGGQLGPRSRTDREVTPKILLLAADEEAASYGLAWLASALRGSLCPDCDGDEMCVFTACPSRTSGGDREARSLLGVGLMEGPSVTAVHHFTSGVGWELDATLAAGAPWIYHPPAATVTTAGATAGFVQVPAFDQQPQCQDTTWTISDPDCPVPPLPPQPPALRDPCWPVDGYRAKRWMFDIGMDALPQWLEIVPMVELHTGARDMRRLTIRFHANPTGRPCTGALDPCQACMDISLAYLPRGVGLRVDGRVQRAVVDQVAGRYTASATPVLYGRGGGLYTWPILECTAGLCVEILAEARYVADDAWASVSLVAREDAA